MKPPEQRRGADGDGFRVPKDVKVVREIVTDSHRRMQDTGRVPVTNGKVQLPLAAMSSTTLTDVK